MTKFLTKVSLALILFSCTGNDKPKSTNLAEDTSSVASNNKSKASLTNDNYFKIGKDSVTILPFEIEVTLSPKAEERIKGKETIIVDVFFNGTPKDNSNAELEEDGSFFVASARKEILYGQVAKFDGIKFSKKIYNQLADKDIDLGVNVYTGRKSSPDNLLNGDVLFDKISNVVNKRFTLKCKLIYGDD